MTLVALGWVVVVVAWLAPRRHAPLPGALGPPAVTPARPGGRLARRRGEARRRREVASAVPDLVDLVGVAVASGLNLRLAIPAVTACLPQGAVRAALEEVEADVSRGSRLADALTLLPARLDARPPADEAVRALAAALVDTERYGTALGPTLERLAAEARRARQRRAEEVARRIPVKLLFPLVSCVLPAFGLLTVAPLIAGGLRALRP